MGLSSTKKAPIEAKKAYREFCEGENQLSLYLQPFWLDLMCGKDNWQVMLQKGNDGAIIAAWPYLSMRKFGMQKIGQPKLTQHLGPHIIYPHNIQKNERILSFEKKIMTGFTDQMKDFKIFKQGLSTKIKNWLPLYWDGYKQTTRYTYVLDEIKNEEERWNGLKSSVKTDIRAAEKRYEIRNENEVSQLYDLNKSTFKRKGEKMPFSKDELEGIFKTAKKEIHADILTAYENENAIASVLVVYDYQKAYSLLIGVNKDLNPKGVVQLLLWESIKTASKRVDIYDFEGSMIPEVESVFRAFGGNLTPYFMISKAPTWFRTIYSILKGKDFSV